MTPHVMPHAARIGYLAGMMTPSLTQPVGTQLRHWRPRRQLSQLKLSVEADVSTRHLSYVETGRSLPSRVILRLAHRLDVPLRERNHLLTSAGFAPMYAARPLADPAKRSCTPPMSVEIWSSPSPRMSGSK